MRKIVQILAVKLNDFEPERLAALCDDGSVFYLDRTGLGGVLDYEWISLPAIPQG